jgi:SAM-dependent methyltransferase
LTLQTDKATEKNRYDQRAAQKLRPNAADSKAASWLFMLRPALRPPYEIYFQWIRKYCKLNTKHLDLCCGDGLMAVKFPPCALRCLADLSENSVRLALKNNRKAKKLVGVVADAEALPFADGSFYMVTCAGSLSYFELQKGASEIRRVLRPGGFFICVDSLDHNWFYKINRWLHYILGKRTRSTLKRMPTQTTVKELSNRIGAVRHISFHGTFLFLEPFLRLWIQPKKIRQLIMTWDKKYCALASWAFKFVVVIQKKG